MSEAVQIALIAILPSTLLSLAVLWSTIRGHVKIDNLTSVVDGKFSEMINALLNAAKIEGKVEALINNTPKVTNVIQDRRDNK